MSAWVTKEGRKQYDIAMQTLLSLHIFQANTGFTKHTLTPSFQKSFRLALTGGGDHMSFGVPCEKDESSNVSIEMLDQHSADKWESILHFMVSSGTDQKIPKLTKGILFLLDRSGLMAGPGIPRITSQGFQFLLNSPHAQLWILLLEYLKISEERNLDTVEVIQFLFMLSTMQLGQVRPFALHDNGDQGDLVLQEYSTENFTPTHQAMLVDLQDYGLLYQRKVLLKSCSTAQSTDETFAANTQSHIPHPTRNVIDVGKPVTSCHP
ncbi:RNA polymerase II transcription factor B 52 kDa subunit [Tulasnella sp. 403]|nr:RNA polymerase II transcription factor B 52 kDa subunit [Tulasnella sp. 403]